MMNELAAQPISMLMLLIGPSGEQGIHDGGLAKLMKMVLVMNLMLRPAVALSCRLFEKYQ